MKKIIIVFLTIFITQGCSTFFLREEQFIRVKESQLIQNEKPYYFVGTNLWYGAYLGASSSVGDRERLIKELDYLKELGITNLRILGASESSYLNNVLEPTFQPSPNNYNKDLLSGLDFLLNEMNKRKMKAVIILNNYWEWSGGFVAYNNWTNYGEVVNPETHPDGWKAFMNYSASFYKNEKGNEIFKNYIKMLLTRKNTFNGKHYFEDPTIMAWQLANEPRPGYSLESINNQQNYISWIDETAKFIKSIDQNHLVSTGSEGIIGSLQIDSIYIKAHQSNYIDYLTFHIWPKNWDWFNPKNVDETFTITKTNTLNYLNAHLEIARKLNKPIVLEEFGLTRDNESYDSNSSTVIRDEYYKLIFELVEDSIKNKSPIYGTNFWVWAGEGRNKNRKWKSGDSFIGDPPHEPQGLYSVFNTDLNTIILLKKHVKKINEFNYLD
ncbi:MAG: mannanase [Melioribacteraceae bacterium]|nr:mannanase [Melioribacteraceae bacterium]